MARYTLDLGEKFDRLLSDLATRKETTKSDIIRRAVATYKYLMDETEGDRKVSITNTSDQVVKDVVIP